MCRTGGRRCDKTWDDAHRERYNARRRITRNTEKAQAARGADDDTKASYYNTLVDEAQRTEQRYDDAIRAHEAAADDTPAPARAESSRCTSCGQWTTEDHDCPAARTLAAMKSTGGPWHASLTAEEADALDEYGSIEHAEINDALRAGTELSPAHQRTVDHLDAALGRAPLTEHPHTLYRGIGFSNVRGEMPADQWVAENCQEGEEITFDAYTSTTTDRSIATYFSGARSDYVDSGVVFEIETRQAGYTGDSPESEVMLRRGTRFEVVSSGERFEAEGKPYQRVLLREVERPVTSAPLGGHPLASRAPEPMDMDFIRNPVSSTSHAVNHDFGQDIEPSGRYLSQRDGVTPDGWESGTVRFEKPLHVDFGASGTYADDDNWKRRLSAHYGGKRGVALSEAVRADGFDAIVTHDKYGTSEIVDLTGGRGPSTSE